VPPALRGVRAAVVFLTRVPAGGFPYTDAEWRWASAHFPLVGALLGAAGAGVWYATFDLSSFVRALLVVIAGVLLTGALHEDGLADTADALGGGADRDRILVILKDSRIGAYGAVALVLVFLLRVGLLADLLPAHPALVVAAAALARTPCVWLMATLEYVTPASTARNTALAASGFTQAGVATLSSALVLVALAASGAVLPEQALAMVAACVAVGLLAGWRYRVRVGGVTGDLLGATVPISECAALLAAAFVSSP
jgi:adenosylcobinamide-GDP ribazoletransferase